ncbi:MULTISPECIES: DUF72 domain-containing protein [unclassified Acidovorax]|uniref:DUF72 domain-containing protein n=1 Tax=unclassified Acidovorax TaxID=2684926 RepID=UPI002882D855|nr:MULTISPECIES: DUF72 domain-containing protein [unclassified Acidovorax]
MQDDLFGGPPAPPPSAPPAPAAPPPDDADSNAAPRRRTGVHPADWDEALRALGAALPPHLRLGTSSWTYPGWKGLVWEGEHSDATLSKNGLPIYAQHPLLRTVSIDRSFYRPLTAEQYARYASQVPGDFRFVVKAPSLVTDALVRSEDGRGRQANSAFLNPDLARQEFVQPALEGLGAKAGALVFQLSPLPLTLLHRLPEVLDRLHAMLSAQPPLQAVAPDAVLAVEVRDPEWLATDVLPRLAEVLRASGATYCLGLHARMPALRDQLQLLRLLWPGPLVCRWNLHPVHGMYGYEDAEKLYAPYDRIHHPDPDLHAELAQAIAGITGRGQNAYVTISNHAEGCAPLTIRTLAEQIVAANKLL